MKTYWTPLRLRLAAAAGLSMGLWLFLLQRQWSYWMLDLLFFILALGLWLGRHRADCLLWSTGILLSLSLRPHASAPILLVIAALLQAAPWLERRLAEPAPAAAPLSWTRIGVTFAIFVGLAIQAARPAWLMVSPERRRKALEGLAPAFPIQPPESLSKLAASLRNHVVFLSEKIGERSAYQPQAQDQAKDYIVERLRAAGYEPEVFDYKGLAASDFVRQQPFHNVIARIGPQDSKGGVWVVGAHYDSAPGTPGADDNASGVAVLLEAARLLKNAAPSRGIVFVAFGTEEPPSFGTRDMGSERCVRELLRNGVKIHGLINLEMLGYYNSKPKSQLFPPFLSLIYPDHGTFLGLVSNLSSVGLAASVRTAWMKGSSIPLETTILPSVFSTLALSDQLNFWSAGQKAVMFSDTSYFRYAHYHQTTDTAEKLDYEKMAAVTEGLVVVLKTAK